MISRLNILLSKLSNPPELKKVNKHIKFAPTLTFSAYQIVSNKLFGSLPKHDIFKMNADRKEIIDTLGGYVWSGYTSYEDGSLTNEIDPFVVTAPTSPMFLFALCTQKNSWKLLWYKIFFCTYLYLVSGINSVDST